MVRVDGVERQPFAAHAGHNAALRRAIASVLHAARFSSECALFSAINRNAKARRAHTIPKKASLLAAEACQPTDSDALRAAALLCGTLQRLPSAAVEAEAHKDLQRGPPQQRQRGLPSLCKIHRIYKTAVDADAVGPRRSTTTRPTRTSSTAASTTRRTRRAA